MSNLAQLTLLKDKKVESWDEYEEWKVYQERIAADAANQSLWSSITGIVGAVAGFVASGGNPYAAKMGYTAGSRLGHEVTEWTGYESGYDSPDIKAGRFNVEEGIKRREDEEDRLSDEKTANIIGIVTDLASIGMDNIKATEWSETTALADTKQITELGPTYEDLTKDWTAVPEVMLNPNTQTNEIVSYQVKDSLGELVSADELAELGISWDLQPIEEVWGEVILDSGRVYNPITGLTRNPKFIKGFLPGGQSWEAKQMFSELYPFLKEGSKEGT